MNEKQGKQKLIRQLEAYVSYNDLERKHRDHILQFLTEHDNNFRRSNLHGHITGSAWLINENGTKVLLNHHKKLNMWMNFGGHADGDTDILAVAIKEAQEESGFKEVFPYDGTIFDVDAHVIPARSVKNEPEHFHYDIRYLLCTTEHEYVISNESLDLRWVNVAEASGMLRSDSLVRMIEKWSVIADL